MPARHIKLGRMHMPALQICTGGRESLLKLLVIVCDEEVNANHDQMTCLTLWQMECTATLDQLIAMHML